MDIVISNGHECNSEKYAIELKFPTNGAVPKRMFQFIKDIKFMEEVKYDLVFKKTYCLSLVSDSKEGDFYSGENSKKEDSIYQYFRGSETTPMVVSRVFRKNSLSQHQIQATSIFAFFNSFSYSCIFSSS